MKKILFFLTFFNFAYLAQAQQIFPTLSNNPTAEPDTIEVIQLNEAIVVGKVNWKNDTSRYKYNQMKVYMQSVLPYALEAVKLLADIDSNTVGMSGSARRKYVRSREKELKAVVSDRMRKLNITQGKYLVKMISRLTKRTVYNIVADYHNPLRAVYHQAWGKLNGINLNETYVAADNKNFEKIMRLWGY